jgi:hypothetical protein
MTEADLTAKRQEINAATDDVVEIAGELADWYDRSQRNHDLGSGDRDTMLRALSTAVRRLRSVANA